jgi:hypothetical protein
MNIDLMLKVADYIEANPDEYDQRNWCGTECCIAGHAVALSGDAVLIRRAGAYSALAGYIDVLDVLDFGSIMRIPEEARKRLDISHDLAGTLFGAAARWPLEFQFSIFDVSDEGRARKAAMFLRHLVAEELQRRELELDAVEVKDEELVLA